MTADFAPFTTEEVALDTLRPHPQNYQTHPDDEIDHLMASIREHGVYRNVVISSDSTILAGHGVVEAARRLALAVVPVYRLAYPAQDPRAIKLLVGDNEIRHLAEVDDRALSELLRGLKDLDMLLGTGYDDMMLANLVMVTRPTKEIADIDAASQWVGLPEYEDASDEHLQIVVCFSSEEDRRAFCLRLGLDVSKIATKGIGKSVWWPPAPDDDVKSLRFTTPRRSADAEDAEDGDDDA